MERPSLHVCIATGQNLANLIPAVQLQAKEVVILETPEMRASAENLKTALESRGIVVRRMRFDDTTPESIVTSAQQVGLELGVNPLVFNVTGGHKLMTLALTAEMEALAGENLHQLYCETRSYRLVWLKPSLGIEPMENVLELTDILLTQGYRIRERDDRDERWQEHALARQSLTRRLGDEADRLHRFFGLLNALADQALNEPGGPFLAEQTLRDTPKGHYADILCQAHRLGLLTWDENNGGTTITFSNPEAARYFRGGWLEEYVWLKLRGLCPKDWATNLKIETVSDKIPNELDAVIVHRNRMLVVECKTRRLDPDANYIYKLSQLTQQVGGSMGKGLLLSARPIDEPVRQRAKEYKVDLLAAGEIKGLVDYLKRWMGEN